MPFINLFILESFKVIKISKISDMQVTKVRDLSSTCMIQYTKRNRMPTTAPIAEVISTIKINIYLGEKNGQEFFK